MLELSLDSPLGPITVGEAGGAIVALNWGRAEKETESPLLNEARRQLRRYFAGGMTRFGMPLAPPGTAFQRRVWRAMGGIAPGRTRSYGALAWDLDSGPRAVAGACARNPIGIIIPCHRVIASDGRLIGYAGGLGLKQQLLDLERDDHQ